MINLHRKTIKLSQQPHPQTQAQDQRINDHLWRSEFMKCMERESIHGELDPEKYRVYSYLAALENEEEDISQFGDELELKKATETIIKNFISHRTVEILEKNKDETKK